MWKRPSKAPQIKEIKDIAHKRGAQNFNKSLISMARGTNPAPRRFLKQGNIFF